MCYLANHVGLGQIRELTLFKSKPSVHGSIYLLCAIVLLYAVVLEEITFEAYDLTGRGMKWIVKGRGKGEG